MHLKAFAGRFDNRFVLRYTKSKSLLRRLILKDAKIVFFFYSCKMKDKVNRYFYYLKDYERGGGYLGEIYTKSNINSTEFIYQRFNF